MTYAEKLKDPRWKAFKAEFEDWFFRRLKRDYDIPCQHCGDIVESWHLHHKIYRDGKEPWEYGFEDIKLVCEECHGEIHKIEKMVRAWIIQLKSDGLYEFAILVKMIMEFERPQDACCVARQEIYQLRERLEAEDRWNKGDRTKP